MVLLASLRALPLLIVREERNLYHVSPYAVICDRLRKTLRGLANLEMVVFCCLAHCHVFVLYAFSHCATFCKSFMLHMRSTVVDRLFFSVESALLLSPCQYVKNGVCLFV